MSLERNSKLINKKFYQYLIPSILMVFAMQFGSLIDGILIGNFINNDALSATSLVLPILIIIQIPGFALGVGGSIVVANMLGKRNIEGAKKVFSFSIIVGLLISFVLMILGFIISRPLANLFSSSLSDYSNDYILGYMITDPIITFVLLMGSFIAVDNNPKISSAIYIVGNVAKVVLEILFIRVFNLGIFGASISTGAGYLVGAILVFLYIKSDKRLLSFTFKIKDTAKKDVLKASFTNALSFILNAIQLLIINIVISKTITDETDIIIFGLIANMVFVFDLFAGGIQNLIPNICGIFYGEKDYYSLKSTTKRIYFFNLGITILIAIVIMISPRFYGLLFGYDDPATIDLLSRLVRIFVLSFIPYEINKFSTNYYPSIDKPLPSIVTVLLKEAILIIPLSLVMLYNMGLDGYVYARLISEFATVIITYIFILVYETKRKVGKGIFMLEKADYVSYDVSIVNELDNASKISEDITSFALSNNIDNRESQIVGLACEEIVNNIISYGYKRHKQNYIDVNLKLIDGILILRIRDDGMPFDPTKYEYDNTESYSTSGINLISKLTDKMTYMRILNLNNTIFEINTNKGENN